jgi:hypothetical protein
MQVSNSGIARHLRKQNCGIHLEFNLSLIHYSMRRCLRDLPASIRSQPDSFSANGSNLLGRLGTPQLVEIALRRGEGRMSARH